MSFDEGMQAFKAGDFYRAAEHFVAVTEKDENNHKAWNALGICLSKTGEYEAAGTCFENALTLDSGNDTYRRNKEKNDKKRQVIPEPSLELDDEPVSRPVRYPRQTPERSISSVFVSLVKIGLGIFAFLIICMMVAAFVFGLSGGSKGGTASASPSMSATEIISKAQAVPYEDLARYPDKYKGKPVLISGQVSQVLDSIGGVDLRVFTKPSEFSKTTYYEDDIFVHYPSPKERVLEKDIITIYGIADGVQDYKTVLGAQRSIPRINAVTHSR